MKLDKTDEVFTETVQVYLLSDVVIQKFCYYGNVTLRLLLSILIVYSLPHSLTAFAKLFRPPLTRSKL